MPIGKRCVFFKKLLVFPYPYLLRNKLNWDVTQNKKKKNSGQVAPFPQQYLILQLSHFYEFPFLKHMTLLPIRKVCGEGRTTKTSDQNIVNASVKVPGS